MSQKEKHDEEPPRDGIRAAEPRHVPVLLI